MAHLSILLLFFFLIRRAPISTLFPYTTLFRSEVRPEDDDRIATSHSIFVVAKLQDRKSTRLNSSHANISYAVFCLKKKSPRDQNRDDEQRAPDRRAQGC